MEKKGLPYALMAFGIWGFVPFLWKQLVGLNLYTLMSERVFLSFLLLLIFYYVKSAHRKNLRPILGNKKTIQLLFLSSMLLGMNWLIFAWAIMNNHVLECGLGYYINPLLSIFLGRVFLGESLSQKQWTAVALAVVAISPLFFKNIGSPWISLAIALTFGLYGLIRKKVFLNSIDALMLEITFMLPVAMLLVSFFPIKTQDFNSPFITLCIFLTAPATLLPLFFFGQAIKFLKLSTIGIMQYIAPTLQIIEAIVFFKEPMTKAHLWAFVLLISALILYNLETLRSTNQARKQKAMGRQS